MSEVDGRTVSPNPNLRWHQFSLRSLMLVVALVAIVASLASTVAWWRTRYPRQSRTWANNWSETAGTMPHFFVQANAINEEMPTIACFARIDDPDRVADPMPWLNHGSRGQVFIEGRHVPHHVGSLRLFVDQGDGRPVLVILEPDDASRYFGRQNTYFTTYRAFVDFWECVLQKKYLQGTRGAPTPPAP